MWGGDEEVCQERAKRKGELEMEKVRQEKGR